MKKIINYDDVSGENRKEQKPHWSQIFDHPYRILKLVALCVEK